MGSLFPGPTVGRVTYVGLVYETSGHIGGEVPDFPDLVAYGHSEAEVTGTLQGLLEEHVEAMLEEHEPLPKPQFFKIQDVTLGAETREPRTVRLSVALPAAASRLLAMNGEDHAPVDRPPITRFVRFNAVIVKTLGSFGGHFPDLPGAFTSGKTVDETRAKLQRLLEFYVGGLVRNGVAVPEPRFKDPAGLEATEAERRESPVVEIVPCTVELAP